ncbi:MAG: 30S ribosomal protein S4 [Candidatus Saccharibacteria bacterium]
MARDTQSITKMSRREGYALHPKALKHMVKRSTLPGQHGRSNRRVTRSQYSLQLREKQKVKRLYGLLERQFSNLMSEANRKEGQSGTLLLQLLEKRADNVVYRAGFATSRRAARQLVSHGHFMLNGRRVDIPSIRMVPGDVLVVRPRSTQTEYFKRLDDITGNVDVSVSWIKANRKKLEISITGEPSREEAEPEINEQLIVEYYSR